MGAPMTHVSRTVKPFFALALAGGTVWLTAASVAHPAARAQATNPDGSLRPAAALTRLFTQDAYTEYALLEPGSESFRIRFLPEEARVGATELVNATRGGSEGTGIEVYDPRTGQPLEFAYVQQGNDPDSHAIRARLPQPVPEGGIGRVLIYKTYKDPRTYMTNGDEIVWVRSLSGYRLGVILPKGYAFVSSNVAAQLSTTDDGRLKLAFANPSGQANPVTIRARRTTATFPPPPIPSSGTRQLIGRGPAGRAETVPLAPVADVFFDDVKTLYDLEAPETGRLRVEQTYSDYRKGDHADIDALLYLPLTGVRVVDLDTAKVLPLVAGAPASAPRGSSVPIGPPRVKLDVPITNDRQSAHLQLTGTLTDGSYRLASGELIFDRDLRGLRNTILLPAGWDVTAVSQSGTIGTLRGRRFVSLINLNSENRYRVIVRARRQADPPR